MRVIARTRGLVDAGMSTADAIEHAEREEDMPSTVARMRELMAEDPKLSPAAALARVNARCDDPQAIAARATAYQARMREHGIKVTAAEAVAHVTREKR
jgi:hypothetical protein